MGVLTEVCERDHGECRLDVEAAQNFLSAAKPTQAIKQLDEALADLGLSLKPQHAGESDPELSRFFVVDARDREEGERIVETVRQLQAVKAAYIKPEAEFP